jgi:hypothetical protein
MDQMMLGMDCNAATQLIQFVIELPQEALAHNHCQIFLLGKKEIIIGNIVDDTVIMFGNKSGFKLLQGLGFPFDCNK